MPQYAEIDELDEEGVFVRDHRRPWYGGGRPPPLPQPPPPVKTATLTTPQGTAILNLPQAVAADARVDVLERRVTVLQAEIVRVNGELALRRGDSSGQSPMFLLFTLMSQKKLRDDLVGHTHELDMKAKPPKTTTPTLPATSSSGFSSLLPLLLFMPGIFGQASTGSTQDAMSPLMMLALAGGDAF